MAFSLFILTIFGFNNPEVNLNDSYEMKAIPDEAIRLRILANSDEDDDQYIKGIVRDEVNAYITEQVQHISHIEEGRKVIAESVPEIETIAASVLEEFNVDQPVQVKYDTNISFPLKVYDNYIYPAGEYEAVLITIGEGKGSNWWCVLFPPLCFLDFSNGTVVADDGFEEIAGEMDEDIEVDEQEEIDSEDEEETEEDRFVVKFFLFEWLGLS